ncbi:arylsulfatase K-like [Branchiostoma lanceolatum]|uniref:arylsulfatase K-like n=1 Tax=Branchiostoma lanceolatum TaxID=7740 RepID=UPI003451301C
MKNFKKDCSAVFLLVWWLSIVGGARDDRKNIVFVICDSMDGRLIGQGPDSVVDLPNLNYMVQNGVNFRNTYTNSPICCPSRSALWSGLHTHVTQSWNNYKGLPRNYPTWQVRLEQQGYHTQVYGKTDYVSGDHSESNRVEAWTRNVNFTLAQEGRPTPVLVGNSSTDRIQLKDWLSTDLASKWLLHDAPKQQKPWLLYLGLNLPHPYPTPSMGENPGGSTFMTSPYWLKKVDSSKVTIPKWLPFSQMHPVAYYSSATKNCTSDFTREEIMKIREYYYGMCAETDAMLGQVLDALKASGQTDSTYVFFTSDHGELAMEHRQFYKMSMYEASAHVPMVLTGPDVPAGKALDDLTSLVDVFPTFMDIANATKSPALNGTSLLPLLKDSADRQERPDWVLSQYHGCNVNMSTYMLRTGSLKYITFGDGPNQVSSQLFDLDEDPDELHNLAKERPDLVRQLDDKLRELVDYPAVTREVQEYNRESFSAWKAKLGSRYKDEIANLRWWKDWQKDPQGNEERIEEWLNQPI